MNMYSQLFSAIAVFILTLAMSFAACDDDDDNDQSDDDMTDDDNDDTADDDDNDNDDNDNNNDDDTASACWTDLPVGEKVAFAAGMPGTEGIAFSADGVLYTSAGQTVARFAPDGTWTSLGEFVDPIGIAFGTDAALYVCDFGASSLPGTVDGAVYRLNQDGSKTALTEGVIPNPNFLTATPAGTLLVSDDMSDKIYELTPDGQLRIWLEGIASPNGMVFAADYSALYVAGCFVDDSPVYRVALDENGEPQGVEVIANLETLSFPDGIALDEDGMLYVAANSRGKIVRVNPADGSQATVASGMTTPASLAFGKSPDYDPCSLYVTELMGRKVWRVSLGVKGQPLADE